MFKDQINQVMKTLGDKVTSVAQMAGDATNDIVESDAFQAISGKVTDLGLVDEETINKIRQKAELLRSDPSQTAQAAINTAVTVARDPLVVLKEIDNISDEMRKAAIEKVKNECRKRGIPDVLVDALIEINFEDRKKLKPAVRKLLLYITGEVSKFSENQGHIDAGTSIGELREEISDIISELLFPESISKDDFGMFMLTKLSNYVIRKLGLQQDGLDSGTFQQLIVALSHLRNTDFESFGRSLAEAMEYMGRKRGDSPSNSKTLEFMKPFLPCFEILGVLSSSGLERSWKFKRPLFRMIFRASGENDAVEKVLNFLNLAFARHELPYEWNTGEEIIDFQKQKSDCRPVSGHN